MLALSYHAGRAECEKRILAAATAVREREQGFVPQCGVASGIFARPSERTLFYQYPVDLVCVTKPPFVSSFLMIATRRRCATMLGRGGASSDETSGAGPGGRGLPAALSQLIRAARGADLTRAITGRSETVGAALARVWTFLCPLPAEPFDTTEPPSLRSIGRRG